MQKKPSKTPKTAKKTTPKAIANTTDPAAAKTKTARPRLTDRQFAVDAARIARDRHCTDIVLLDLRGLSPATDYFLIATGTSDRQSRTVADEMMMLAKKKYKLMCFGNAGYEQGQWILLDFVNVVVHLFDAKYRDYYNLEMLWGDAKQIDY